MTIPLLDNLSIHKSNSERKTCKNIFLPVSIECSFELMRVRIVFSESFVFAEDVGVKEAPLRHPGTHTKA